MEPSEEHMFDQAELEAERLEERNGKDIQGAFFEERSDDGSESEGSLRDFLDDAEEEPASPFHMHRAIDRERSLSPPALPRTRRRHVLYDSDEEHQSPEQPRARRRLCFQSSESEDEGGYETPPRTFSPSSSASPHGTSPRGTSPPRASSPRAPLPEERELTPLENLERKWGVGQPRSPAEMIALACANLDAQDGLDPLRIDAASRQCWSDYASGIQWFTAAFRDGRHVPFGREEVTRRFEALKSVIRQAKEGLLALLPRAIEREERDEACVRTELISAWYDRACLYGLRALQAEGCEQFCYSEVKSNGYNTRAYKVETTIQQALFDTCDCLTNEVLYNKLTSQGGFQTDIPAHISANRNDPRFPLIQKDRHVFAFSNGLYVAWLRKSLLRTPVETCGEALSIALDEGAVRDFFIPYEGGRVEKALKAEVCACKYFDHPFDEAARLSVTSGRTDWYALATPNLQQILDAQRLPEEACRWLYAFIGRMIYSVGELDGLQLIVYLKGVAGTGKSLILEKVLKEFYEPEDVGILSNNSEELFGLSAIYDKNLFYCSEVNNKFNLEQSKFQQMISGESVSVPIKYKTAISQPFKPHGFLAGNETFRLKDVSGSLSRRVVPIHFPYPVLNRDPDLAKRVQREVPMIILKANLAYHWALQQVTRDGQQIDFWSLRIPYFAETSRQFASQLDPLRGFLTDPGNGLIMAAGNLHLYCPLDVLLEKVRSGMDTGPSSAELAQSGIWAELGLLLFMKTGAAAINPPYPRFSNLRLTKRCWIFGADILGEDEGMEIPQEGLPPDLYEVVAAEYAERFPHA